MEKSKKESNEITTNTIDKSIIQNSFFNVIYQLLNVLFPFITSVYVSHILCADGVGKVAYAQNIMSYFLGMAPLGLLSYGVKEIAKVRKEADKTNICFTELFLINIVSTTVFAAIYYVLVFRLEHFQDDKLLFIVFGLQLLFNYINVDWFFQGIEEYGYITLRSFITKIVSLVCLIIFVRDREAYIAYALINSLAIFGNHLFNIFHVRKKVKFVWKGLNCKKHIRSEIVLLFNVFLSNIYSKVDITMLGLRSDDAVTGYYSNAFKIVNLILCICLSMTDVLLPRLSRSYEMDKKEYSMLIAKGSKIVLFLVFPTMVGLSIVSPLAIPFLFGNSFIPSVKTVMILSPLIIIKGFGNIACYQVAISSGNEMKQTYAYILGAMVNILLNTVLIPIYKHNGAAIASVVSELLLNTVIFIQLRKISEIKIEIKYLMSVLCSSVVMGVVVKIIISVATNRICALGLGVIIGMITYLASAIITKNEIFYDIYKKYVRRRKEI